MRVTLLANPDNLHVRRWIDFLAGRGHQLTLVTDPFTINRPACCEVLEPRWNLLTKLLAFRLTPKPYGNDLWKPIHYRSLVRRSRPEVVHGFEAFNYGLATALAGPYPRVLTPWGNDVYRKPKEGLIAGGMVGYAVRHVDMISTNDETIGDYLGRRFGVPAPQVRAFSWGVDLDIFRPGLLDLAQRWRQKLAISPAAPVVLSPRNFDPYWGSELLTGAIPAVLAQSPEVVFIVLRGLGGAPALFDAARHRADADGYGQSIRWIEDPVSSLDLAALFNLAQAFVSVPRTDLLAQTILEGMACGCLPVLANHATYRKHLRPGENGLAVTEYSSEGLAAALLKGLDDKELRERAGRENPVRMIQHENWRVNALQIEDVYFQAIDHFEDSR